MARNPRGPKNSILKRWHALTISPKACRERWQRPYGEVSNGYTDVPCRLCPRFDRKAEECGISYGTYARKCAAAAIEAHLNDVEGLEVLEIGCGSWPLARTLVRRGSGRWSGIDPGLPREQQAGPGKAGYGHAAAIPFPDRHFDLVFGIQTLEHWGQLAGAVMEPSDYGECLAEVHRVLKPGARLYLDAPMHYHGHEMFIMADVDRIRGLFDNDLWSSVKIERWRRDYQPLDRFLPSDRVLAEWDIEVNNYPSEQIQEILESGSAWLLTINARAS